MYLYDEEKERYYFAADLKEYLLNHGVDANHIIKMKNKILEESRDEYYETMSTSYKEHRKLKFPITYNLFFILYHCSRILYFYNFR